MVQPSYEKFTVKAMENQSGTLFLRSDTKSCIKRGRNFGSLPGPAYSLLCVSLLGDKQITQVDFLEKILISTKPC